MRTINTARVTLLDPRSCGCTTGVRISEEEALFSASDCDLVDILCKGIQ